MKTVQDVLERYREVAPPILAESFAAPRWCLNGTRVTMTVLRSFRLHVKPLSVQAVAINGVFAKLLKEKGGMPESDEESVNWGLQGAWAVMIDTKNPPDEDKNSWPGHLVAIVNNAVLIDVATTAFRREDQNLVVPPAIMLPINRKFRMKQLGALAPLPLGGQLIYEARPDDRSFDLLSGFQNHVENQAVAERIRRAM